MKNSEKKLIKLIREEYKSRIVKLLKESTSEIFETEMFDKEGNQLLSQGLKVRHKASGYEYTIDHVEGDDDEATVFLRHPEVPRFKSASSELQLTESDDDAPRIQVDQIDLGKVSDDSTLSSQMIPDIMEDPMAAAKEVDQQSLLKITKKEFEKEYEVK